MKQKSGLRAFWGELRRRKVVRAGGMYVAAGFVVLQLGEIVLPAFNAPDWVLQSLVVVAFLGLPVALGVAWAFDLTDEGIARARKSRGGGKATIAPRLALVAVTSISVGLGAMWFQRTAAVGSGGGERGGEEVQAAPARQASLDPNAPITAIAVLPLADFAQDDDLFARQLHEEIITQLSLLTSIRVTSRTSVERYADADMLLPAIAAELGVQAVVTGSVAMTPESDSVRISIQLLHAATDTHMLSRSFQREMRDILRLQTEIAVEIAQAVQGELGEDLVGEVDRVTEVVPEAYRELLQGQRALEEGTPEGIEAALAHLGRAVELDPAYATALAWRAGARLMLASARDSLTADIRERVRADVERARVLGGAEDEIEAIVILSEPLEAGLASPAGWLGEPATDSLRRRQLSQGTRFGRQFGRHSRLGVAMGLLETGLYDSAAVAFEAILDADPEAAPAWIGLEEAYLRQGSVAGAVDVRGRRIVATADGRADAQATAADLRASFDDRDPASYWRWLDGYYDELETRGEHVSAVERAKTAVGVGEHEEALAHLGVAVRNRDPGLLSLRKSAVWDPLRRDSRFQEIMRNVRGLWRGGATPPPPAPPRSPSR